MPSYILDVLFIGGTFALFLGAGFVFGAYITLVACKGREGADKFITDLLNKKPRRKEENRGFCKLPTDHNAEICEECNFIGNMIHRLTNDPFVKLHECPSCGHTWYVVYDEDDVDPDFFVQEVEEAEMDLTSDDVQLETDEEQI